MLAMTMRIKSVCEFFCLLQLIKRENEKCKESIVLFSMSTHLYDHKNFIFSLDRKPKGAVDLDLYELLKKVIFPNFLKNLRIDYCVNSSFFMCNY